jgi:phosphate transport system protein
LASEVGILLSRLMDIGLERLKRMLLDMAHLSEETVNRAIEIYSRGGLPSDDIFGQSEKLRILQEEVSELAVEIIARYQPVATDLRFIKSCMEIAYGYSRFGRYAYDIAEVLKIFGDISGCDKSVVEKAGAQVKEMIEVSTRAFSDRDIELARRLRSMDDVVDEIYSSFVSSVLKQSGANLKCSLSGTLILRYLERIADHAKYIGDSVIYIITGETSPRL